ncbi:MAG: 50S ribosomal protein L9 [Sumerlaeia bacterium]
MKVVLFKSVDNLGQAGELVDVKRGYYRNFLGPRGFAREASKANVALMEQQSKKLQAVVAREREEAKVRANDMDGIRLEFKHRANDNGQLFGSVTTTDVAAALAEKGFDVDRRKIEIGENIRTLGEFPVKIRLYTEVYANLKVIVERFRTPDEIRAMEEAEERAREQAERKAAKDKAAAKAQEAEAAAGPDADVQDEEAVEEAASQEQAPEETPAQ